MRAGTRVKLLTEEGGKPISRAVYMVKEVRTCAGRPFAHVRVYQREGNKTQRRSPETAWHPLCALQILPD